MCVSVSLALSLCLDFVVSCCFCKRTTQCPLQCSEVKLRPAIGCGPLNNLKPLVAPETGCNPSMCTPLNLLSRWTCNLIVKIVTAPLHARY